MRPYKPRGSDRAVNDLANIKNSRALYTRRSYRSFPLVNGRPGYAVVAHWPLGLLACRGPDPLAPWQVGRAPNKQPRGHVSRSTFARRGAGRLKSKNGRFVSKARPVAGLAIPKRAVVAAETTLKSEVMPTPHPVRLCWVGPPVLGRSARTKLALPLTL